MRVQFRVFPDHRLGCRMRAAAYTATTALTTAGTAIDSVRQKQLYPAPCPGRGKLGTCLRGDSCALPG